MNKLDHRLNRELRNELLPLVDGCPLDAANPESCPLYLVRKMSPEKRLAWFNSLGGGGLAYLASYHHVCLNTKLAAKFVEKIR